MSKLVITIKPTAYRLKFLTKTVEINQDGGIENLSELTDVDNTDKADGRILAWNEETGKHEYKDESGGVPEAPTDGKQYARKDAAWSEVVASGGGGGGFQTLTDATETLFDVENGYTAFWTLGADRNFPTISNHAAGDRISLYVIGSGFTLTQTGLYSPAGQAVELSAIGMDLLEYLVIDISGTLYLTLTNFLPAQTIIS